MPAGRPLIAGNETADEDDCAAARFGSFPPQKTVGLLPTASASTTGLQRERNKALRRAPRTWNADGYTPSTQASAIPLWLARRPRRRFTHARNERRLGRHECPYPQRRD